MRTIKEIAKEIKADWKNPYFGAIPYIEAMLEIERIGDNYLYDSAHSIVLYFLANAGSWRGDTARRIKLELKTKLNA